MFPPFMFPESFIVTSLILPELLHETEGIGRACIGKDLDEDQSQGPWVVRKISTHTPVMSVYWRDSSQNWSNVPSQLRCMRLSLLM